MSNRLGHKTELRNANQTHWLRNTTVCERDEEPDTHGPQDRVMCDVELICTDRDAVAHRQPIHMEMESVSRTARGDQLVSSGHEAAMRLVSTDETCRG